MITLMNRHTDLKNDLKKFVGSFVNTNQSSRATYSTFRKILFIRRYFYLKVGQYAVHLYHSYVYDQQRLHSGRTVDSQSQAQGFESSHCFQQRQKALPMYCFLELFFATKYINDFKNALCIFSQ
jgi:hypothetical protein